MPTGSHLGTKTITVDGIYRAEADNLDGYSEVKVTTGGGGGGGGTDVLERGPVTTVNNTAFFGDLLFDPFGS